MVKLSQPDVTTGRHVALTMHIFVNVTSLSRTATQVADIYLLYILATQYRLTDYSHHSLKKIKKKKYSQVKRKNPAKI